VTTHLGELSRAFGLYEQARREAERFGHGIALRWLAGEQVIENYWRGLWDEALMTANALFADSAGPGSLQEMETLVVRAGIGLARDEAAEAERSARRALELGEAAEDAQSLLPALAVAARVALQGGRRDEATDHVEHLISKWDEIGLVLPSWWVTDLAVVLEALERNDELDRSRRRIALATPWFDAATSGAEGNWLRAAGIFVEIGSKPDEAYARLRAAEQLVAAGRREEAERELAAALAFFTDVDASAYVERAQAVVAARA
jgi:tetratricopeptide (TPR) repeat protein